MDTVTIKECTEPWLYWWHLLMPDQQADLKKKYFPDYWPHWTRSVPQDGKQQIWEQEGREALVDGDWLALGDMCLSASGKNLLAKERKEIWRQLYRIASAKM